MKKAITFLLTALGALLLIAFTGINQSSDKNAAIPEYIINANTTKVEWTAYKTTAKVPVSGVFKTVLFDASKESSTLHNLSFSIPANSVFTKNEIRDRTLKKYFFRALLNTQNIKGKIELTNATSGFVHLNFNGLQKKLPISIETKDNTLYLSAELHLDKWNALSAVESLNTVCKDLHTGGDGITKTWSDVLIKVSAPLADE